MRGFCGLTRRDIDDLKSILNKSEYDKHIEPYQRQINHLLDENHKLDDKLHAMFYAADKLIKSINDDYINVIVTLTDRTARLYDTTLERPTDDNVRIIQIPIKRELKDDFLKIYYKYYLN